MPTSLTLPQFYHRLPSSPICEATPENLQKAGFVPRQNYTYVPGEEIFPTESHNIINLQLRTIREKIRTNGLLSKKIAIRQIAQFQKTKHPNLILDTTTALLSYGHESRFAYTLQNTSPSVRGDNLIDMTSFTRFRLDLFFINQSIHQAAANGFEPSTAQYFNFHHWGDHLWEINDENFRTQCLHENSEIQNYIEQQKESDYQIRLIPNALGNIASSKKQIHQIKALKRKNPFPNHFNPRKPV